MNKENMEKFKKELPPLPKKEDFKTFDEYDNAYLVFQKAHLEFLAKKYPDAFYKGEVWYGTCLPPEEVFKNGLSARESGNFDLEKHQRQFLKQEEGGNFSALRGAGENARIPAMFADEGGYIYKVIPHSGGIVLDTALGEKFINPVTGKKGGALIPGEKEIVIGSRQPTFVIEGCRKVGNWSDAMESYRLGEFIKNPNFKPAENKK